MSRLPNHNVLISPSMAFSTHGESWLEDTLRSAWTVIAKGGGLAERKSALNPHGSV